MSLKLELGLFNMDFMDHHAILGVPIDADPKDIRKQYLQIARRLHPDSHSTDNEGDRQKAQEFLSKLVNPAYEKLSNEKTLSEYGVLLRLKGQQAQRQQETVVLFGDAARQLASVGLDDLDLCYRSALRELTSKQYQQLQHSLDIIGQISELNLVYLMRKDAFSPATSSTNAAPPSAKVPAESRTQSAPPPPPKQTVLDAYLRRADEFEKKGNFPRAILELREASQMSPTDSVVQSRLGVVYMKVNQPKMAKIHFNQALKLNPQDAVALEGLRRVDPTQAKAATTPQKADSKATDSKSAKSNNKGNKPDNKSGGLFGLFGGKKK